MTLEKDVTGRKSFIFLILAQEPLQIRDLRKKLDKYLGIAYQRDINEKGLNYALAQLINENMICLKGRNKRNMFYNVNYSNVFQKFNEMFKESATESDIKKYYFYKNKELKKIVRYFFIGYIGWSQRSYNFSINQILQDFVLGIGYVEQENELSDDSEPMTEKERQKRIKKLGPDEHSTAMFRFFCQEYRLHHEHHGVIDFIRDLFHPRMEDFFGNAQRKRKGL